MESIVGFNLSSYSHCTSYTRLTTDTGNCCRSCGWPFINSTNIVSRLFSRGMIIPRKLITNCSPYLKSLVQVSQEKFHT